MPFWKKQIPITAAKFLAVLATIASIFLVGISIAGFETQKPPDKRDRKLIWIGLGLSIGAILFLLLIVVLGLLEEFK